MGRVKCTEEVDFVEWITSNLLFSDNVHIFDRVFKNAVWLDEKYYVEHPIGSGETYEDYLARALFSTHETGNDRIYILTAPVGFGKSEFCRHLSRKTIPQKYPKSVSVIIDCFDRLTGGENEFDGLQRDVANELIDKILKHQSFPFERMSELGAAAYKHITNGDTLDDSSKAVEFVRSLSLIELIRFVVNEKVSDKDTAFLIVFDNIDECSSEAFTNVKSIASIIADASQEGTGKSCVLIPMRDYTVRATDTTQYPNSMLPPLRIDIAALKRLEMLKEELEKGGIDTRTDSPSAVATVDSSKHWLGASPTIVVHDPLEIAKYFLLKISSPKSSEMRDDFIADIVKLSGANNKTVFLNLYYMFHSCKLNLVDVIKYTWSRDDSIDAKELKSRFMASRLSGAFMYDLLMAVHTPFFDYKTSLIPNLFSTRVSGRESTFRDTLVNIRILGYIFHKRRVPLLEVENFFERHGFSKTHHIHEALNLMFETGLLMPDFGISISDLSPESELILSDPTGEYYFETVMLDKRYIEYVFDDVYMDKKYIVPIKDRYQKGKSGGNLRVRDTFFEKVVQFLKSEEQAEKEFFRDNSLDYDGYRNACFHRNERGQPVEVSQLLERWLKA